MTVNVIRVGEIGRDLYVNTGFDLSGNTSMSMKATITVDDVPYETLITTGITAPAVDSPAIPGFGVLPADEYMLYTTDGTEFIKDGVDVPGDWTLCVTYNDASPKTFYGADTILTIGERC